MARETEIMVDESSAWNDLASRYLVKTINHQVAYSMDGTSADAETLRCQLLFRVGWHHARSPTP